MTQETTLIHISELKGTEDEVYIGRAGNGEDGYFGNPVKLYQPCPICGGLHVSKGATLGCYEAYLISRINKDEEFRSNLKELRGKKLICFCTNKDRCHGSVMIRYIKSLNDEALW